MDCIKRRLDDAGYVTYTVEYKSKYIEVQYENMAKEPQTVEPV